MRYCSTLERYSEAMNWRLGILNERWSIEWVHHESLPSPTLPGKYSCCLTSELKESEHLELYISVARTVSYTRFVIG